MSQHLYLSFTPEALIYSMLDPGQFGKYLALGDKKQTSSHAIFIEIDPSIKIEGLQLETARSRCVPHENGHPRRSAYVSIYRVLERVPLSALGDLHLTTKDGLMLTLKQADYTPNDSQSRFMYQEFCPVSPRVVSNLEPKKFCKYVTGAQNPLYLPKVAFAAMKLGDLAEDPANGQADDLPYPDINHLRSCLQTLGGDRDKKTKIERRGMRPSIIFYMIEGGIYIGDQNDFIYYPMPNEDALLGEHHAWWNSAAKLERY